jgi:uncharacterized protein YkwD
MRRLFDRFRHPAPLLVVLVALGCNPRVPIGPGEGGPEAPAGSILELTNARRSALGLAPLRGDARLEAMAADHAIDLGRHGTLAHDLPGRPRFAERLARSGYRPSNPRGPVAGEVIAGTSDPSSAFALWMGSPPHRRQLLDPGARAIGEAATSTAAGSFSVAVVGY